MPHSDFHTHHGAHCADDLVLDYGDAEAELRAAAEGDIVAPLSNFAILRVQGEDAESFLHGQLTCDVKALRPLQSVFGGYCTAQGRLLANFLLCRDDEGFLTVLRRDIAAAIHRRLQMFVLRAKVKITDVTAEYCALGLKGLRSREAATAAGFEVPQSPFATLSGKRGLAIAYPGDRLVLMIRTAEVEAVWTELTATLRPVGTPCWDWLEIAHGLPWIVSATQDQFVPQMVNLELIGGVNFQKGCYPGQEVVARTQYRAKTKRRMHLAGVGIEAAPGMELYSAALGEQASGMIVNAARAPGGGWQCLAVLHPEALSAAIHIGTPDGPALELLEFPYRVE